MKNPLFSFHPAMLPGKQQRKRYGRTPYNRRVAAMVRKARGKSLPANRPAARSTGSGAESRADLVSALVNLGYVKPIAKQAAAAARGTTFDEQLRDALAKVKNPMKKRNAIPPASKCPFCKMLGHPCIDHMPKRKKKKKNGKMPAGLRKYWAKIRAKKNARRRAAKAKANPRKKKAAAKKTKKTWHKAMGKVGSAKTAAQWMRAMGQFPNPKKRKRVRRRRRNPVRKAPRMVRAPFPMTATQLKKYARTLARATGKRVVIKSK